MDQVFSFCKGDETVAAFLRTVLTAELTNEGETLYFHNKIYRDALEKAVEENPVDSAQKEAGSED